MTGPPGKPDFCCSKSENIHHQWGWPCEHPIKYDIHVYIYILIYMVWCYHRLWPSTDFLFDTPLLVMAIASITELPYHFELAVPSLPAWHRAHSCHQSDTSGDTKSDVQRTKSPPLHQRWSTAASKRTSRLYPSPHAPVEKKQRIWPPVSSCYQRTILWTTKWIQVE